MSIKQNGRRKCTGVHTEGGRRLEMFSRVRKVRFLHAPCEQIRF